MIAATILLGVLLGLGAKCAPRNVAIGDAGDASASSAAPVGSAPPMTPSAAPIGSGAGAPATLPRAG